MTVRITTRRQGFRCEAFEGPRMPPALKRAMPTLRMFDVAKAREFYVDCLGFSVDFEHRFHPFGNYLIFSERLQ